MSTSIPDEQAALLTAIVAHSDEDTPRLVYADWLQEHGDEEQAQFIREGIRLAGTKGEDDTAIFERLDKTVEEHGAAWLAALGLEGVTAEQYHRGLPLRVSISSAEAFFAAADTLFAFVPLRRLSVGWVSRPFGDDDKFGPETLLRLAETTGLRRLTELRLDGHDGIPAAAWGSFFRSPHLAGLRHLGLTACGLREPEARELAASPALAGLTELDIGYNSISSDGLRALYDSPHLKNLNKLVLELNIDGDPGEDAVLALFQERSRDRSPPPSAPPDENQNLI